MITIGYNNVVNDNHYSNQPLITIIIVVVTIIDDNHQWTIISHESCHESPPSAVRSGDLDQVKRQWVDRKERLSGERQEEDTVGVRRVTTVGDGDGFGDGFGDGW